MSSLDLGGLWNWQTRRANWVERFVSHDALLMMERFGFCMHSLSCLQDFADDFIPNFSLSPYSENLTKQAHERWKCGHNSCH